MLLKPVLKIANMIRRSAKETTERCENHKYGLIWQSKIFAVDDRAGEEIEKILNEDVVNGLIDAL